MHSLTVTEIGDRREIFVDRALITKMENTALKLEEPRPEEISIRYDHPAGKLHAGRFR